MRAVLGGIGFKTRLVEEGPVLARRLARHIPSLKGKGLGTNARRARGVFDSKRAWLKTLSLLAGSFLIYLH